MSSGFSQLFLKLVKVISTVKVISGQFDPLKIDSLVSFVKGEDKIVLFLKTALLLYILQLWVLGNGFDQARLGWGGFGYWQSNIFTPSSGFCQLSCMCNLNLLWCRLDLKSLNVFFNLLLLQVSKMAAQSWHSCCCEYLSCSHKILHFYQLVWLSYLALWHFNISAAL